VPVAPSGVRRAVAPTARRPGGTAAAAGAAGGTAAGIARRSGTFLRWFLWIHDDPCGSFHCKPEIWWYPHSWKPP